MRWLALIVAISVSNSGHVWASDEDDSRTPGLIARYSAGDRSIERVDSDVQFDWERDAPDQRLPSGPFAAHWTGKLLIRSENRPRLHLFLRGEASIALDGRVVLMGSRDQPGWISSEPLDLDADEYALDARYRSTGGNAVVRLFWSSETSTLEPVPPQSLAHAARRADLEELARGAALYATYRCNRCHRRAHEALSPAAAAIPYLALGALPGALKGQLTDPHGARRHPSMPMFGFNDDDADAIAAYLSAEVAAVEMSPPPAVDRTDAFRRGELLFRSVGCLACHTRDEQGTHSPASGGDLTRIGQRRTEAWIATWLKEPARLNPAHRMPVVPLSDAERRELAIYLAGLEPRAAEETMTAKPAPAAIARGRTLVQAARCAACHDDGKPADPRVASLVKPVADWSKSCIEADPDQTIMRLGYGLPESERRALRAYVAAHSVPYSPESRPVAAQRILLHNNCLSCHERDGGAGLGLVAKRVCEQDPDLIGQSESLLPPDLTAAGDKLHDRFLEKAVAGLQEKSRLPWLRVRMPAFRHSAEDIAILSRFLIDHDRLPDSAPEAFAHGGAPPAVLDEEEQRKIGQVVAGARGFNCVACHKVGGFEPRNVALATRGSDLYALSIRMRPEFFRRWVRSPIRVVPNMEMPSFDKPLPELLGGDYSVQIEALWAALNDPRGAPTLDTSRVEQIARVDPGMSPIVIRDVFNTGNTLEARLVARAFAMGFESGAGGLFDLDTMTLRAVWSGPFARQRALGKSWFWEPAGAASVFDARDEPDLSLRPAGQNDVPSLSARRESGRFGRLVRYESRGQGVSLEYRLAFDLPRKAIELRVLDEFSPVLDPSNARATALRRLVRVENVPDGYDVQWNLAATEGRPDAVTTPLGRTSAGASGETTYALPRPSVGDTIVPAETSAVLRSEAIHSVPGYDGIRLPLPWSIMPTAITWTARGQLALCSLKGHVYLAHDSDGDGLEDRLSVFEEGLAAPYGLIADGPDLIVAHKPELLRLRDTNEDGRADVRQVQASGWGYTDDYHDWTTGIVRDSRGRLYVGTGSDYARRGRSREQGKWRGKVLRIERDGEIAIMGHAFRYPTGLAITPDDQVFVTDNQGVQNTFNEINHLVPGGRYGVPSLFEEQFDGPALAPAIQIPHPWTRSVNGIFFLPDTPAAEPFAGHGIGCEYDNRFLVRFTLQRVGETYQGAVYPFSRAPEKETSGQFRGTLCGAVAPNGDLLIGSFLDSGWLGGPNVGDLVRLRRSETLPCGIREIRAFEDEFHISFTTPIDRDRGARRESFTVTGATRNWQGTYATPDSGRHVLEVRAVDIAPDGLLAVVKTDPPRPGHVYEIACGRIARQREEPLWPAVGHYTMNRVPQRPGNDSKR
jgi:mono/diheme cytochrome c family protein/glucose/arabinose dehydrogenase